MSVLNDTLTMMEKVEEKLAALAAEEPDDESSGINSEEGGTNLSDSDPKDSGIDCGDVKGEMPDEATSGMLLKTVEFYLSDGNILKDPFLLKHVRRNKEGYVSVKLLSSFRKIRSLCHNWKAVSKSIEKSEILSLNADGTKVKRLIPLPDYDETVVSRTIIVYGFETDKPTVDNVSEIFAKCGDIALVRILRPGGSIPSDVKRFLSKNPEIQSKVCALVEFEEHASAKKAMEGQFGVEIVPMLLKEKNKTEGSKSDALSPSPKDSPKKKKKNRRASNADKKLNGDKILSDDQLRTKRSGSLSSQSSGYLSSSPGNSFFDSRFPRRHSYNTSINYKDPKSSFASLNNRYNGSKERLQKTDAESSGNLSPWRRRREQMMLSDSNLSSATSSSSFSLFAPVKTLRMPRGPDGTKGFCPRQVLPSTAE